MSFFKQLLVAISLFCSMSAFGQSQGFESLSAEEFAKVVADSARWQVLDVRTAEEFASGRLPGAVNVDVRSKDFGDLCLSKLRKDKPVAVYCRSGRRSKVAAERLVGLGFVVKEMDGGILSWRGPVEQ